MRIYQPLGDCGLQIAFARTINPHTITQIRNFQDRLDSKAWTFQLECVASYTTLTLFYDPMVVSYAEFVVLCKEIEKEIEEKLEKEKENKGTMSARDLPNVIEIPVLYGGEFGPDLGDVARVHGYTPEQVIDIHSAPHYLIYLIGFTPGFPYLGGMSKKIATPRLSKPRLLVKAGSVGIANDQTGIYSIDSPGGWRIIGRTPYNIYNPSSVTPFLLKAGDTVKFKPITREEYDGMMGGIEI